MVFAIDYPFQGFIPSFWYIYKYKCIWFFIVGGGEEGEERNEWLMADLHGTPQLLNLLWRVELGPCARNIRVNDGDTTRRGFPFIFIVDGNAAGSTSLLDPLFLLF